MFEESSGLECLRGFRGVQERLTGFSGFICL